MLMMMDDQSFMMQLCAVKCHAGKLQTPVSEGSIFLSFGGNLCIVFIGGEMSYVHIYLLRDGVER